MNIFLLFLTTILMIGYYVIYSPSQNLEQLETENVIKTSDLRSIAECVIASQNAAMNSVSYDDLCVDYYNITSQYICTNDNYVPMSCDGVGVNFPTYNYIVTNSKILDTELHANMLKVIETLYQDRGALGICLGCSTNDTGHDKPFLITADISGQRTVAPSIVSAAHLEDGQLVYVMQYQIPSIYVYPERPGDKNSCPMGTIAVRRYGRWLCIAQRPSHDCPSGLTYDSETGECKELPFTLCEEMCRIKSCSENQTCVCYDTGEVACTEEVQCPAGQEAVHDSNTDKIICIDIEDPSNGSPCSGDRGGNFAYSGTKAASGSGRTARIKTIRCDTKCLKATKVCNETSGFYEYICLPDPSTIKTQRECFPEGGADECGSRGEVAVVIHRHVGEQVVGDLGLSYHVDVFLEEMAVFVGWSPYCSAGEHICIVHHGGDGGGVVIGAIGGGIHVAVASDVCGAEHVVPLSVEALQSHQAVFHAEYLFPLSKELDHFSRASCFYEGGVHVEEQVVGLYLNIVGACQQMRLQVGPVAVVIAFCEVEVAVDGAALDVYSYGCIAVDVGVGGFPVVGVVHLIVDEAIAGGCHEQDVHSLFQRVCAACRLIVACNLKLDCLAGGDGSHIDVDVLSCRGADACGVGESAEAVAKSDDACPTGGTAVGFVASDAEVELRLVPSIVGLPCVVLHLDGHLLHRRGQGFHGVSQVGVAHCHVCALEFRAGRCSEELGEL